MNSSESPRCYQCLGLGMEVEMVVVLMHVELVQTETYRVCCKSSRNHKAVDAESDLVPFGLLGVQPAVKCHSLYIYQSKERILAVGIDDVRVVGESYSSYRNRRKHCLCGILIRFKPDDVPVCVEAVV